MAVLLRSGRELNSNRTEQKEKTDQKEEKLTRGENGKSMAERTT